jgi:hypothetical protein
MSAIRTLAPLAFAAVILAGFSTGASAYQCKNANTVGHFATTSQPGALAGARATWTANVKGNYGLSWSVWNIATGRQESCVGGGGGSFICTVKARPCNYVVQ